MGITNWKPWKILLTKVVRIVSFKWKGIVMTRHDVKPGQVLHRRHNGERVVVVTVCHLPGDSLFTVTPSQTVKNGKVFHLSSGFRELPVREHD